MKKAIISIFATVVLATAAAATSQVYASCEPIYGGGEHCPSISLTVNKKVQNPSNSDLVDNLGINDPKFAPDQSVTFQIVVTNTSNQSVGKTVLADTFPQFVNFTSGSGSFNNDTKVLTIEIDGLAAGESKTFTLQGKTASAGSLPSNAGITCISNHVSATIIAQNVSTSDTAQLCIEKKVLGTTEKGFTVITPKPVAQAPATGANVFALLALIPTAIAGMALRKKSNLS